MQRLLRYALIQLLPTLVIGLLLLWGYDHYRASKTRSRLENRPQVTMVSHPVTRYVSTPPTFVEAAQRSRVAVVSVRVRQMSEGTNTQVPSSGSGVIIRSDGYIVTNYHVVEFGAEYTVTLEDRRTFEAQLVGYDPDTDLAVLKIEASHLPYLGWGDSDAIEVGSWVMAIGYPLGLQSTVTAGILSAKGRDIDILNLDYGIESFLQTDAMINAGNSGGALVDTDGDLIGISTAILSDGDRFEGYAFAVPAKLAEKVANDLIEYGIVHRGLLGITGETISAEDAEDLNIEQLTGVRIITPYKDGAAQAGGLRRDDVITAIDELPTDHLNLLSEVIGRYRPGDTVRVSFLRNGKDKTTDVILRNHLNTTELIKVRKDEILLRLGLEVRDLLQSERKTGSSGAKVISIAKDKTIFRTKMEPGFIITAVDDYEVKSVDDLIEQLKEQDGRVVLEGYYEQYEGPWWYTFKMP